MAQLIQLVGALLVLSGFAGSQFRILDPRSFSYLIVNAAGSAILAVLGYYERQWGFFLLEFVWALVSLWGIVNKWNGRRADRLSH